MTVEFVGADPELFVRDAETKEVASAIGILGGTKDEPRVVERGAIQEDNVLAEFNIDPASTREEFYDSIQTVMKRLHSDLAGHGLEPYICASHVYTKPYLKSLGGKAFAFGCDPDINAWTGEQNEPPNAYTCLRSAGGHVHISFSRPTFDRALKVVRAFEVVKSLPDLFVDTDNQRRELYGKSGACRVKDYGVEIRSPSNYWLKSKESIHSMFDAAIKAESLADNIDDILAERGVTPERIQDVINNSKLDEAEVIMKQLAIA